jgi:drug/metabolite transporter (DMT)-like permease
MSSSSPSALPRSAETVSAGVVPAGVALILAALAMSISPVLVRLADVGPYASAFWRVALALPLLYAWMRRTETGIVTPERQRFGWPTLFAGLAFAGDLFFWHLSIARTTIANATFFATTAPLWVVVFGWLLFRSKVSAAVMVGLGLCLAGGAALVAQSVALDPHHLLGDAFGIATGLFFGLYFLAVEAARRHAGAARTTFGLTVVAALLLLGVAALMEPVLLPASARGWAVLLALALISHVGGQGLLSVALGRLPVVFSSLVIFLEAVAAAGFAWVILGEPVSLVQAAGGLLIILGIWTARPRVASRTGV